MTVEIRPNSQNISSSLKESTVLSRSEWGSAYPFHELLERLEVEMVLEFSELADELVGVERGPWQQHTSLVASKPVTTKIKTMF